MDAVQFRKDMDDGRERVLFCLIHILKSKYSSPEELATFLVEWYRYSSSQGNKLSDSDILKKVKYHWKKQYNITIGYLNRVIEEIN
jgi:hypothetical protein